MKKLKLNEDSSSSSTGTFSFLQLALTLIIGLFVVNFTVYAGSNYQDQQEEFTISGVITSDDIGPLPGATILIIGTQQGTVTDGDGKFQLSVKANDRLLVSFVGYTSQEILVTAAKTVYEIKMASDSEQLSEIVVIGYGTQKKSHLTGAISKVENETLYQLPVSRVDDALIGQVSGVNIQATNAEAGAAPTITIRGVGSITADSGPAVVVDGVVVSSDFLGTLDMNDVESFEVLKDAASAAIYGSEGSNGVIMITTKSGKAGETRFSYQGYVGFKQALGSDDYRKSAADWIALEQQATGEISQESQYVQKIIELTGVDRDWQDVFFDGGIINSHSLSARGGSENTQFSASLRYLHDEGVVITDDYKFFSGRIKVNTKLSDRVKFGLNINPSYTKRRRLPTSIHNPTRQSPWLPIYHTEESLQLIDRAAYPNVGVGDYFWENHLLNLDLTGDGSSSRPRTSGDSNPYQQYVEREHWEYNTNVYGSTFLSAELIDGLVIQTSLGVTFAERRRERWDGTNYHASRFYFSELLNAGVKIFLYRKGFVHAKTVVADTLVSVVGTANMDIRSFDLNFEIMPVIYGEEFARQLEEVFLEDLKECSEVKLEDWQKLGLGKKLIYASARLISSFL